MAAAAAPSKPRSAPARSKPAAKPKAKGPDNKKRKPQATPASAKPAKKTHRPHPCSQICRQDEASARCRYRTAGKNETAAPKAASGSGGRGASRKSARKSRRAAQPNLFAPEADTATAIAKPKRSRAAADETSRPAKPEPKRHQWPSSCPRHTARSDPIQAPEALGGRRRSRPGIAAPPRHRRIDGDKAARHLGQRILHEESPPAGLRQPGAGALDDGEGSFRQQPRCSEEAGILPTIRVELVEINEERYRVIVEDNGPGIVKAQIPKVFGKLLYGSKFHRLRQSRGQQGIGISAAGMYGQLTTGKPIVITSKTGKGRPAHHFEIVIDTARNTPNVVKDEQIEWDHDHGTRVEIELTGTYKGGRRSVDEYIEQAGIANPHAEIFYQPPKGRPALHIERATTELPREPLEIQPHPYGVELGMLQKILQDTEQKTLSSALQSEFSRVTPKVSQEILERAHLSPRLKPGQIKPGEVERLHKVIPEVKIFAPPTACVVPIGEDLIRKGLEREIQAEFYTSATRPPAVYRGNPFQVEAGLAYGGSLRDRSEAADEDVLATSKEADATEGPITLLRLANRVPLQYQQSSCAVFKSVIDTNWRSYGLTQPRGSLPQGPMVLLVHMASVWVPFTSESKEAVAHYPEILKEMQLALQELRPAARHFLAPA
jgi:DNA topoisomerase-6 subunit B